MSVEFLHTNTGMRIKPVIGEPDGFLFEIQDGEFLTVCCREKTSYDLVIKDSWSGFILYCINGAEIENHPVEVYFSEGQLVGRIKDGVIDAYQLCSAQIQDKGGCYTIEGTTVTVTPGQVQLSWPQNWSSKLKVLSIVFGLHIALTKHKATVFNAEAIAALPVVLATRTLPWPSGLEKGSPKQNKLKPFSVFSPSREKQEFRLTAASSHENGLRAHGFLMTKGCNRIVNRIEYANNMGTGHTAFTVRNTDKKTELAAEWLRNMARNSTNFLVRCSEKISCEASFHWDTEEFKFLRKSGGNVFTRTRKLAGLSTKQFVDEDERVCGTFISNIHTLLDITFSAAASPYQKKVILTASIFYFGEVLLNFKRLPIAAVSYLTCNCRFCHKAQLVDGGSVPASVVFTDVVLTLKAAGHNKRDNVVYFDLYQQEEGSVICTLEVTPVKKLRGTAKIVGKTGDGTLLFTSLDHPNEKVVSIYDHNDKLIACIIMDEAVYNNQGTRIMEIAVKPTGRNTDERRFGPNIKYEISDDAGLALFGISTKLCSMQTYRPRIEEQPLTVLQIYVELTLAAKLHSSAFSFDSIPTPEIFYSYRK